MANLRPVPYHSPVIHVQLIAPALEGHNGCPGSRRTWLVFWPPILTQSRPSLRESCILGGVVVVVGGGGRAPETASLVFPWRGTLATAWVVLSVAGVVSGSPPASRSPRRKGHSRVSEGADCWAPSARIDGDEGTLRWTSARRDGLELGPAFSAIYSADRRDPSSSALPPAGSGARASHPTRRHRRACHSRHRTVLLSVNRNFRGLQLPHASMHTSELAPPSSLRSARVRKQSPSRPQVVLMFICSQVTVGTAPDDTTKNQLQCRASSIRHPTHAPLPLQVPVVAARSVRASRQRRRCPQSFALRALPPAASTTLPVTTPQPGAAWQRISQNANPRARARLLSQVVMLPPYSIHTRH